MSARSSWRVNRSSRCNSESSKVATMLPLPWHESSGFSASPAEYDAIAGFVEIDPGGIHAHQEHPLGAGVSPVFRGKLIRHGIRIETGSLIQHLGHHPIGRNHVIHIDLLGRVVALAMEQ